MSKPYTPPPFLIDLLNARSPSGYEAEAQRVWTWVAPEGWLKISRQPPGKSYKRERAWAVRSSSHYIQACDGVIQTAINMAN